MMVKKILPGRPICYTFIVNLTAPDCVFQYNRLSKMVFAEEIRNKILRFAEQRGPRHTFNIADVAKSIDPENWQNLIEQVRLVASSLVKEGKIIVKNPEEMNDLFSLNVPADQH